MKSLSDYSLVELRWVIALREKIEALQEDLDAITGESAVVSPAEAPVLAKRKYHMTAAHKRKLIKALVRARKIRWAKLKGRKGKRRISAAGRAAMSAAGKARWARVRGTKATPKPAKKRRTVSPQVKAKLAAAAKARWAKVKAEGKTTL